MRLWLALGLLCAACTPATVAPVQVGEVRGAAPVRATSPSFEVYTRPAATGEPNAGPTPSLEQLPALSLADRPKPPEGVRCVVYGRGSGLFRRCGERRVNVNASTASGVTTAVVDMSDAEFAWGLYPGRAKGWIFVDDGTFLVEGFSDLSDVRFALREEVAVVSDRVWLNRGIAVRALGADEQGVAVAIDDDVPGIQDMPAHVPCDALLFDSSQATPAPASRSAGAAPAAGKPSEVVYAAVEKMPLYLAPGGAAFVELGTKEQPFSQGLKLLQRKDSWVRVGFETESARFQLWARDSEIGEVSLIREISISSCCGGGIGLRGMAGNGWTVVDTTRVRVGPTPLQQSKTGVSIHEGANVDIVSKRNGFVAVHPRGRVAIEPPEGSFFWVPEDKLRPGD